MSEPVMVALPQVSGIEGDVVATLTVGITFPNGQDYALAYDFRFTSDLQNPETRETALHFVYSHLERSLFDKGLIKTMGGHGKQVVTVRDLGLDVGMERKRENE